MRQDEIKSKQRHWIFTRHDSKRSRNHHTGAELKSTWKGLKGEMHTAENVTRGTKGKTDAHRMP